MRIIVFLLFLLVPSIAFGAGQDANTAMLLHLNGTDGATATTDATGNHDGNFTFGDNAQLDTGIKKWGTASLLLDGTGDYLSVTDSADWDVLGSATQDYTVDFWVKHGSTPSGQEVYTGQYESGARYWLFENWSGSMLEFDVYGQLFLWDMSGGPIADTDWHHVAVIKVTSAGPQVDWGIYLDGTQIAYESETTDVYTYAAALILGDGLAGTWPFEGNMDEYRVQKSNYFVAAPDAGLTDTITVPTEEYSEGTPAGGATSQVVIIS